MKRFKNILYIVREGQISDNSSAEKVSALARLNEARVTLLLVDETFKLLDVDRILSQHYQKIKHTIQSDQINSLRNFAELELWKGVDIVSDTQAASNFLEITQKVISNEHDLLIMEEAIERGIDQLAMRLVRKCPCPIWIIKSDAVEFRRILAAVDVETESDEGKALNMKIVELAYSLAQRERGEAHYLHSWRLEYESMLSGPRFNMPSTEIQKMKSDILSDRRKRIIELLNKSCIQYQDKQLQLIEGKVEDAIKLARSSLGIDVVVMGSVARSGIPGFLIGNKAEKILETIDCSVLTVKPDNFISPVGEMKK